MAYSETRLFLGKVKIMFGWTKKISDFHIIVSRRSIILIVALSNLNFSYLSSQAQVKVLLFFFKSKLLRKLLAIASIMQKMFFKGDYKMKLNKKFFIQSKGRCTHFYAYMIITAHISIFFKALSHQRLKLEMYVF